MNTKKHATCSVHLYRNDLEKHLCRYQWIEYGGMKSPREVWKGAADLDRQVTARSACWGVPPPPGYPVEQVVYVRFRGDWSKDEIAVQAKLKAVLDGPAEKRHVWTVDRSPYFGDWATAMAPVNDLEKLVQRIDFAEVLFYDTEHHAMILGLPKMEKLEQPKEK